MEQPDGCATLGKETSVRRLKKGLYELVQTGRTWNEGLNLYTEKDPVVYVKSTWNQAVFAAGGFGLPISLVLAPGRSPMLWKRVWMRSAALLSWVT